MTALPAAAEQKKNKHDDFNLAKKYESLAS